MTHFGIICPPVSGHINPMAALGRELIQRGHRVTVFQLPDVAAKIITEGLEYRPIGQSDHLIGSLPESITQLGKLSGLAALRFALQAIEKTTNAVCRDAPQAIQAQGIEALLVDQTEPAGATVADYLDLPFVTICCAMNINREPTIPPIFTAWPYQTNPLACLRNQFGYALFDWLTQPVQKVIARYRQQWQLKSYQHYDDSFSRLAQISQQPPAFDFKRKALPKNFYYTGPFRSPSPQMIPFPYEKLTGQPLIYASLGTQQNTKAELFHQIAAACEGLEVQLVISHGGGMDEASIQQLAGSPLVVSYAPQYELLAKAQLTITHAGLNTVLDSLTHGVPLVAIPITYEQPAIASRLQWLNVGEVIPLNQVSIPKLKNKIEQVLTNDIYRQNAAKLKTSIQQAGGVKRAAEIIEQVIDINYSLMDKFYNIPAQAD
ncbi:glycosyltransferase [Chroococcus sp. FPU101]|uniref:glycosyltransferase n=1 Tax=Chroococcus sp. FPU101 TaxID=1974212 RepID=UPI001A8F571D|nr:glycosyltransferase [Chroococcus sp. FPU101]GFE69556.1 glycosyltransferase, MGT family [Chroococcus sp. FPU101]